MRRKNGCAKKCKSCCAKPRPRTRKKISATVGFAGEMSYRKSCSDGKRASRGFEKSKQALEERAREQAESEAKGSEKAQPTAKRNTTSRIQSPRSKRCGRFPAGLQN